jgi:hypothetical protein
MLPELSTRSRKQERLQPLRGAHTVWVISVRRDVRMYTPDLVKSAASWASRPPSDARPKCVCAISRLGTSCPTHPQAGAAVCRQLYEAHGPPPLISIPTQAYFILLHTSYCTTATSSPRPTCSHQRCPCRWGKEYQQVTSCVPHIPSSPTAPSLVV